MQDVKADENNAEIRSDTSLEDAPALELQKEKGKPKSEASVAQGVRFLANDVKLSSEEAAVNAKQQELVSSLVTDSTAQQA